MIKKYDIFLSENMNHAKSIIAKKMEAYEKLKTLLSSNIGYIGKFTEYLMHENIPYSELESLYKKLLDLKSKNVNVNIQDLSYEKLLDKIEVDENTVSINRLINQFPSEQKKLAKSLLDRDEHGDYNYDKYFNIFLKASKKSNLEFLISKISRYKTKDDLKNALSIFCKDSKNDKESIKNTLKDMKSDIVYEDENTLIVHVDNIEDIKILGSDSSWCILQKSQWDSYTKGRKQFILFDYTKELYDPLFKVGFTLNLDGTIHAAHDLLDKYYNKAYLKQILDGKNIIKSVYKQTDFRIVKNITTLKEWLSISSKDDIIKNLNNIISKLVDSKNNAIKGFTGPRMEALILLVKKISGEKFISFSFFDNYPLLREILIKRTYETKINKYSAIPGTFNFYYMSNSVFLEALQNNAWSDIDILNFSDSLNKIFKGYNLDYSKKEVFRFEDDVITALYHTICRIIDKLKLTKKKDIDNRNNLIAYAYLFNFKLSIDNRHFNDESINFAKDLFKDRLGLVENEISIEDKYFSNYNLNPNLIPLKDTNNIRLYEFILKDKVLDNIMTRLQDYKISFKIKESLFNRILDGKFKTHQIFWKNNMKIINMIKNNTLQKDNITIHVVDDDEDFN